MKETKLLVVLFSPVQSAKKNIPSLPFNRREFNSAPDGKLQSCLNSKQQGLGKKT